MLGELDSGCNLTANIRDGVQNSVFVIFMAFTIDFVESDNCNNEF